MPYASFQNANIVTQSRGMIVRGGLATQCLLAQADSIANVFGLLGTRIADVLAGASGQINGFTGNTLVRMDAAPAVGALVYVSPTTPGVGTTTPPSLPVAIGICYAALLDGGINYAFVTPIVAGTSPMTMGQLTLGAGLNFHTTDVNAAGPYVVLTTDCFIRVRYTATGAISINMPLIANVEEGHLVAVVDSGYNATANNITVVPNGGDKINNVASDYTINVTSSCLWFMANKTTNNWEIV